MSASRGSGDLCHDQLTSIEGVTVITPRDLMAGLIHFTVDSAPPADVVKRLAEENILIRAIPEPSVLRASIGFYNTEEEIARLSAKRRGYRARKLALSLRVSDRRVNVRDR